METVIESTGRFSNPGESLSPFEGRGLRVIVTAPMKDPDITIVIGVNEEKFNPAVHKVLQCFPARQCSCTRCEDTARLFRIQGLINTTHAYTNDQSLLDFPHSDLRRARAAFLSLTDFNGAARAIGEVIPDLKGVLMVFCACPHSTVSLLDIVALLAGYNSAGCQ